jgi:hypothetical protein
MAQILTMSNEENCQQIMVCHYLNIVVQKVDLKQAKAVFINIKITTFDL